MLPKFFVAVAGVASIGAGLLSMQQQSLLVSHAMSDLHLQMDGDRKATWDAQAKIAEASHPAALREAVDRVGLDLRPLPSSGETDVTSPGWPDPDRFTHAPPPAGPARPLLPPTGTTPSP
jgi:hypothetical protein